MNVIHLTEQNFENEVLRSPVPVLVDFFGTFCGPCLMLAPMIEELAGELVGKAKVCSLDVSVNPQLASAYRINAVPSFLIFKDGRVSESLIGVQSKRRLIEAIER